MISSLQRIPVALVVLPCLVFVFSRPFDDAAEAKIPVSPEAADGPRVPAAGWPGLWSGVDAEDPARWFGIIGCVLLLMGGRHRR